MNNFASIDKLTVRLRDDFNPNVDKPNNVILLFAHNGTGKTRLSMEFKNRAKKKGNSDTLYFNAFTEDLFSWDNDLENDTNRVLRLNSDSRFFNGFKELDIEEKIFTHLERYADFDFKIDYNNWQISFSRQITIKVNNRGKVEEKNETINNIKISRGEENIFIWCIFLSIYELVIDGDEAYSWVKYIYIDDPVSSLDENNVIAIATDLASIIKNGKDKVKTVISSHHSLFFNIMCNELRNLSHKRYFLHKTDTNGYTLQATDDTPFFHHVALLCELKAVVDSDAIKTYHFNTLRSILEKTSVFFGYHDFSDCISGIDDEVLYSRALNLLSHGKYSVYEPAEMNQDNKNLFKSVFNEFLTKYQFYLPELIAEEKAKSN